MIKEEVKYINDKLQCEIGIRNVNYIKNLVTNTLKIAELNSPNIEFSSDTLNLRKIIIDVLNDKSRVFEEKNINFKNNVDKKINVIGDKLRLMELFDNLISNAVKYTPKGGSVTIDAKQDKKFVTVSIKDTGIGLAKNQIPRIFDEFYKVDTSRHEMDSSGLGLSICKRIVEKHNGKIWVESQGKGKGSTFYFTLKNSENKKTKEIMVVDDNIDIGYTIKKGLEQKDNREYNVFVANSGKECLKLLESEQIPDVILLDIMMPEMSGWDVFAKLKENSKWRNIPIIFLTAKTDPYSKGYGKVSSQDYIEKPFEIKKLKNRIDKILGG